MSSESPETSSAPPDNSRASEPTQNRATDPVALSSPLVKPIRDVWFYTAPRYRVRASVLLAINLVLYAGLCVFTHWLHTAEPFTFDINSYTQPARFWGEQTVGLNNFLLYPINVTRTPWHGIVLGLLMAAIVATPIAVAILYRFPAVFPFAACVLVLAHMPWMSFTLVCSAVLAALPPFRLKFRFGSALVALIPIMVHMYLSTLSTVETGQYLCCPRAASATHLSLAARDRGRRDHAGLDSADRFARTLSARSGHPGAGRGIGATVARVPHASRC
jgi:hypothetical protein